MRKIWLYLLLLSGSSSLFAQTVLTIEGQTYNSSATGAWLGVSIPRNQPTKLTFRNNSITSVNYSGYLLQAGDEAVTGTNNNLNGEEIYGNKFIWNGTNPAGLTHGVFTGYNINAILKYNYLVNIPLGLIRKSNGMTNTSGGISYNIVVNSLSATVTKGMKNVKIINNTFYSSKTTSESSRGLVDIYTNTDNGLNASSTGNKVFNNIFYTKHLIANIKIYDNASVSGFESDYNVFWCEDGEPVFVIAGAQKTFSQWQALGYDQHSRVINPNFRDLVNFVPAVRLDYGINPGSEWEVGLAEDATWGTSSPKTSIQSGPWQVGARVFSSQMVPVSSINVTGAGGSTIINTDNGTLQLSAAILPSDATNKTIIWSVENGTGQATISASGLLAAVANGTVTVSATANDGSGVKGSLVVTLSNQVIPVTSIVVTGTGGATRINSDNGTLQLLAEILPANATNKTITWSIASGTGIASVNASGLLQALDNGTVLVRASATDGSNISGTISITVTNQVNPVTNINITGTAGATTISTNRGTLQLIAEILPANSTDKTLTWSIQSGAGFATVNQAGLLTAVDNGVAVVKAAANDGSNVSGTISITISNQIISVIGITVNGTGGVSAISTDNGTLQLIANILPANATNKTVTWSIVSGTGIATVASSGIVTATDNGNVTVKAAANDGSLVYGTFVLAISNQVNPVASISITGAGGSSIINTNKGSLQLIATILPANASNKNVVWSLVNGSGKGVINASGLVTASENGTVTAEATATDGTGVTGSVVITILNQIVQITAINISGSGGVNTISTDKGSLLLIPEILPSVANNKTLSWSISNGASLATVNSSGVLTAKENGTITVKASSTDGSGVYGTIVITITNQIVNVTGITVTGAGGASIITTVSGTLQLNAMVLPVTATNKAVTWSLINGSGTASINSSGLVTASSDGIVTAVATAADGSNVTGSMLININSSLIPVTSIALSGESGRTTITTDGGTLQLSESVLPINATDKSVHWTIENNTGQASVSSSGLVSALGNGTVTVTATANDGSGITGIYVIIISNQVVPVSSVNVSGTDGASTISTDNGTLQMISEVLPLNASVKTIAWSIVNNTGNAAIDATGLLSAVSNGTVTVIATATDGSGVTGSRIITIANQIVPVSGITVTGAGGVSAILSDKGTLQLSAAVLPAYASDKIVVWSITGGTDQATISYSGVVTAISDGTVTATATADDGSGVSGNLTITISNQIIPVAGITVTAAGGVNSITTDNGTLQLNSLVVPANATDKAVTWSIQNDGGLASVNASGVLTAIANGTIIAMATAHDGSGVYGTLVITISNQIVTVSSIVVSGSGGITGISTDNGSLQMIADVLPSAVVNKNVTWSLENNPGLATINSSGHLTALENGTVRVRATSQESPAISGFMDVAISNQITLVSGITITGAGGATTITADNGTLQLSASVLPANATDKSVTWSITINSGLASINSSGLLTAGNNGVVTIQALANDGSGAAGTYTVTITNQVVAVSLITVTGAANATVITQNHGTLQLTANVSPANAGNKTVTWTITNGTGQATISSGGLVSAITNGTVTARASSNDGSGVSGTLVISIFNQVIPITNLTITGAGGLSTITTDNGTLQMSVEILPANATNKSITWSVSSGTTLAAVSASGLVTAYDNGTVVIKAATNDGSGISATKTLTITNQLGPITSIFVSSAGGIKSINVDDGTLQMYAAISPSNTSVKTVTWSFVNDNGFATINTNGLLTAVQDGTVTVKATANDGSGVVGTMVITITNQIVPVSLLSISAPGGLTAITQDDGTLQLTCLVYPENATNKDISWSVVNNTGKASIDGTGLVTAEDNGTVTVRAMADDDSGVSTSLILTISGQVILVTDVIVTTPEGITSITENKSSLQLTASVIPSNASIKSVTWAIISGKSSASIDANGLLTPRGNGVVIVNAKANDASGKSGSVTIPILNQEDEHLTITVTRDEIKVFLNASYLKWDAGLYNLHGNKVIDKQVTTDILVFDISNLSPGLYLVVLTKGENIRVAKVNKP